MFKRVLPIFLAALMLFSTTVRAAVYEHFPDVPMDAEYAEAVNYLAELGIFSGDNNGNFNPDKTITRAEFAAVIVRMMSEADRAASVTKSSFTDVPSTHWACGYVTIAVELGLVSGYGNGKFGPGDTLTDEQAIKVLVCALGDEKNASGLGGYPNGYIAYANNLGLATKNEVQIGKAISRAKVAILLSKTIMIREMQNGLSNEME